MAALVGNISQHYLQASPIGCSHPERRSIRSRGSSAVLATSPHHTSRPQPTLTFRRNRVIANEAELAQRASQRDPDAFAVLYDAYVEKIYKYIYYKVGNPSEAEDLCEQVFLKAWEAIGRYTWYGYPFSSWLYRLAHNLV